jgi:hypothetical protein
VSLALAASGLVTLAKRVELDPLQYFRPTPPQLAFLRCSSPVAMLRAGNQLGKTWAGVADCLYRALGDHPYQLVPAPPQEIWIVCVSWEQSLAIQKKVWQLVPKRELKPDCVFVEGKGFTGRVPVVRFRNGSIIRIKTGNQGAIGLAGATISHVLMDEVPPAEVWSELAARVLRQRGKLRLTLTPVGRPAEWLKELVDRGEVVDLHYGLSEDNLTPFGGRPLLRADEITRLENQYLPQERRQRIHGDWSAGFSEGRVFAGFDDVKHVTTDLPAGEVMIGIGIDHGSTEGSQVATLCAVDRTGGHEGNPRFWILDQAISSGLTTPEQDAHDILAMLKRNGLTVESVDRWVGDRKHGGRTWGGKKSNALLMQGFERVLKLPIGSLPFRISTAWKPRGSVFEGARILHAAMLRPEDFHIHPRCKALIEDLRHWCGDDDEHKHGIDSLRYGAVELVTRRLYVPQAIRMR